MSLTIASWKNFAASLWQKEAIRKLAEHVGFRDENGDLVTPVPDPHPQYFHLISDTAWGGMHIDADKALTPGDVVAPYDRNSPADWVVISDLLAGTITLPEGAGGGYQFNYYFTFQTATNGGEFIFEVFQDGVASGAATAVNLSNQSNVGNGALVGFSPILDNVGGTVIDVRFDPLSTKAITMLNVSWSMVRLFPPVSELS